MYDRPVNDPLEPGRGLRFAAIVQNQAFKFVIDIVGKLLAELIEIDIAGTHNGRRIGVIQQSQKQVLERRILVAALVGIFEGSVERLFKTGRE